ncbi:MAG: peptide chain release factor family protein, partial [Planctomycetota bacterium]
MAVLTLDDEALLAQCRLETFRASGPGGQHRNKVSSGVRLHHEPTGVVAEATERRSQHENRRVALRRLRMHIACRVRGPVDPGPLPAVVVECLTQAR